MADIPGPIMALGDQIANLKLSEAALLKMYLKDKYGIEPAAGGGAVVMAGPAAPTQAAAPVEEKTEFTVVLEGLADPGKKIPLIKVVREITGCGLSEGKNLVDGAPKPIKENIPKDEAEAIKKKLEEAGGKVSLK
jgi:large subunit ribosomal protein L7/L12